MDYDLYLKFSLCSSAISVRMRSRRAGTMTKVQMKISISFLSVFVCGCGEPTQLNSDISPEDQKVSLRHGESGTKKRAEPLRPQRLHGGTGWPDGQRLSREIGEKEEKKEII